MNEIELNPEGPHSPEYTVRLGNVLSDAVRTLNYATSAGAGGLEYPGDVYSLLGSLARATAGFEQLLTQVETFLHLQAEQDRLRVTYGLYEGNPQAAIATILDRLDGGRAATADLTVELGKALSILSTVGGREEE